MSRLTKVLIMFLAGHAVGLPVELATHSAKVNATNSVTTNQVREIIEAIETNNGTVPATLSGQFQARFLDKSPAVVKKISNGTVSSCAEVKAKGLCPHKLAEAHCGQTCMQEEKHQSRASASKCDLCP